MRIVLMGSGAAWPIPRIRCTCPQCAEARTDPRFVRGRTGILVEGRGGGFLLDASADIYRQLDRQARATPETVVISHAHADHCYGLGDAAAAGKGAKGRRQVRGHTSVLAELQAKFGYLFGRSGFAADALAPGVEAEVGGLQVTGLDVHHTDDASFATYGFVIRDGPVGVFVSTDFKRLEPEDLDRVRGLDLWIMDGSGLDTVFPSHASILEILELRRATGGGALVFTHVGHLKRSAAELKGLLAARTPDPVWVALDGTEVRLGPEGLAVAGAV